MNASLRGGSFWTRLFLVGATLFGAASFAPAASAQTSPLSSPRLKQLRAAKVLSCAAEQRPGFADADDEGNISGLAVDLCRAVAIATLGPDATIRFSLPQSEQEFAPLAHGRVDLAFLTDEALDEHHLRGTNIAGPTVFIDPLSVMVPADAPAQHPADIAGQVVCVMIGSPAQRALMATLQGVTPPIAPSSYSEDVEMLDGYNIGNCTAAVEANSRLVEMQHDSGVRHLKSKILTPPLGLIPVRATAPAADGAWAALAFATLEDLLSTPEHPTQWDGATPAIPGLRASWRADVAKAVGSYAEMRTRYLGKDAPVWPNAAWPDGLLMPRAR